MQAALEMGDVSAVIEVDSHGYGHLLRHPDDRSRENVTVEVTLHVLLKKVNDNRRTHLCGRMDHS